MIGPLTPSEQERIQRSARGPARTPPPVVVGAASPADAQLLFDTPGDGRIWAMGSGYKASFGSEGFVYVPFFGAKAPRNFPLHFVLRAVRSGNRDLGFASAVLPARTGDRVVYDRGPVREIYDLTAAHVEQSFAIDAGPGDLELEIEVRGELREDAGRAGVQFGNGLGLVHYGDAFVVEGADRCAIATTFADGAIRLRVPAAERPAGTVVIDPIIHTSAFTHVTNRECRNPDIAYDASSDRYMVVWEHQFSATDTDVFSEFRRGDGTAIAGSLASIDFTTLTHAHPRVANINSNDLFLVVMQRLQGAQWQIWGRRRLATSTPQPELFPISDPSTSGHCVFPDVGGDPDGSGPARSWLVVWERQYSATDFDIHARIVEADTSMQPTLFIENSTNTIYCLPAVSQSNGAGMSSAPHWLIAYQFRFSPTDWDIYCAAVSATGVLTTRSTNIDTSLFLDTVPSVSSPATDGSSADPLYLVTYERAAPAEGRARVLDLRLANRITPTSLARFGLGPLWVRAESDGCRFAVLAGNPIGPTTLALANGTLVRHDAPTALPGVPSSGRIASKRSGGGSTTDYGIAYVDEAPNPDQIWVAAYRGHAGGGITRRATACLGLAIAFAGEGMLGETLRFTLTGTGTDLVGHVLGLPAAALPVCPGCSLGVDVSGPLVNFPGSRLDLPVPCDANLVGLALAVQGYAFGSGTCLGSGRFSDTIDFTIR